MSEHRCSITGNPSGTDTWEASYECPCAGCQEWLAELRAKGDWPPRPTWFVGSIPDLVPTNNSLYGGYGELLGLAPHLSSKGNKE